MTKSKIPGVFGFDMMAKAQDNPDFPIVTFEAYPHANESVTYSDIVLKGTKLARAMEKMGIGRGDKFVLIMKNHPEYIYAVFAASVLGAVTVPLDPRSKGSKLAYQVRHSDSKAIIFSAEYMALVDSLLTDVPELKTIGCLYKEEFEVPIEQRYPDIGRIFEGPEARMFDATGQDINDAVQILYTSGTTGDPKGMCIANYKVSSGELGAQLFGYTSDDILYTGLSLTHSNAQAVTLAPALYMGIPAVISRKFTKSRLWNICRQYGCTSFSLLGGMMVGVFSEPPRPDDADNPVRLIISAGTPMAIWREFEQRFGVAIHEFYGTMEGGFVSNPPGKGPVGSIGKPVTEMGELKVVREDGSECEPGEKGEIIYRNCDGPTVVNYYKNEEASKAKIRDGWLRTGDICHTDRDGWYYFDFRMGGGLRRAGDFIMPEYVESVLSKHPLVDDVCVYGIKADSGAPGESDVVAGIVPAGGRDADIKGLFDYCLANLEKTSLPDYIQILETIPKTVSEKNLNRLLQANFNHESANVYKLTDYR